MHPPTIRYQNAEYHLGHLSQSFGQFDWKAKSGLASRFSVRVRYSDHCYSREIKAPDVQAPDDVVVGENPLRVFCTARHAGSKDLTAMTSGLFAKPTTTVALTSANRNWHIYQLYSQPSPAMRYCVFFRVKREFDVLPDGTRPLSLFVESAYARDNPVPVIKQVPFGRVAEMTWDGERYF